MIATVVFRARQLCSWLSLCSALLFGSIVQVSLAETIPPMDARTRAIVEEALRAEDRGDFQKAIALHKQVVERQPRNSVSLNAIAGLYGTIGDFNQELVWAQKAIRIDPTYDLAFINLGNAYTELHDFAQARKAFLRATEVNKTSPIGFYSLGILAERQHDLGSALSYYQKSLAIDPNFGAAMLNLGATYANLGKFKEAKIVLEQLVRNDPQSTEARALLNEVGRELKDTKQ